MKIVVFGAAGTVGTAVVAEACARGHAVTAVVRRPTDAPDGARPVVGDFRQPQAVLHETKYDAVVSAVGAGPFSAAPDYAVYTDAARELTEAVRGLPPGARPRILAVGGAGSLRSPSGTRVMDEPDFPAALREEAAAQGRALELYRSTIDVAWTYVSPAARLEPGPRTGRYRVGDEHLLVDAEGASRITVADYAVAVVDELEGAHALGRRMTVAY